MAAGSSAPAAPDPRPGSPGRRSGEGRILWRRLLIRLRGTLAEHLAGGLELLEHMLALLGRTPGPRGLRHLPEFVQPGEEVLGGRSAANLPVPHIDANRVAHGLPIGRNGGR